MKGIFINCKTTEGRQALEKHIQDKKKESFKNRMLYKQTFEETPFTDDKGIYALKLLAKHRYFVPEAMIPIARDMMNDNGATPLIDYEITIIGDVEE